MYLSITAWASVERMAILSLFPVLRRRSSWRTIRRTSIAEASPSRTARSWSPQGNQIVFSWSPPDFQVHSTLWVVHSDGSGLRRLQGSTHPAAVHQQLLHGSGAGFRTARNACPSL